MGGGGGGGGGGGQEVGALSQQQRQIISGTFNIQRDRKTMTAAKVREGMVVLTLAQSKLRDQVNGLVERMNSRLVVSDPSFKKIAELLPKAAEQMTAAEKQAAGAERRRRAAAGELALQFLQQAEEEFELQVQTGRQAGGGGGGGGAGSIAEDLADLFKMEMDKMANQYETNSQASTQQQDQQIDELAEKLKELARRQEQEIERQRRLAAGQSAGSSGGDLQRALAEQAEEAARQLEKLSRDQNRQDLADTARQLRNAADAMKRAAAKGDPSAAGQAAAAADRLREAQRQLHAQPDRARRARRPGCAAPGRGDRRRSRRTSRSDAQGPAAGRPRSRCRKAQMLGQRKDALESKVAELEKQLDRMVGEQTKESRDTARKLTEAAVGHPRQQDQGEDPLLEEPARLRRAASNTRATSRKRSARTSTRCARSSTRRRRRSASRAAIAAAMRSTRRASSRAAWIRWAAACRSAAQQNAQQSKGSAGPAGQSKASKARTASRGKEGQQGKEGQPGKEGSRARTGSRARQGQAASRARAGPAGPGRPAGPGWPAGPGRSRRQRRHGRRLPRWRLAAAGDRSPLRLLLRPDDVRQFRGEARRWAQEGQALRNMLREQNVDPKEFDEIMKRLRELDSDRVYQDVEELARLQTFVSEGMKRFEYALRRKVGDETDRALVNGSEEVPAEFKALVEEYYRSLSKGKAKQ